MIWDDLLPRACVDDTQPRELMSNVEGKLLGAICYIYIYMQPSPVAYPEIRLHLTGIQFPVTWSDLLRVVVLPAVLSVKCGLAWDVRSQTVQLTLIEPNMQRSRITGRRSTCNLVVRARDREKVSERQRDREEGRKGEWKRERERGRVVRCEYTRLRKLEKGE